MQRASLEEIGGAVVLALPENILHELHLAAGAEVDLAVDGEALVVRRKGRKKYKLDDLLDNTDPRAFERTAEDWEWVNSPPVGRELL